VSAPYSEVNSREKKKKGGKGGFLTLALGQGLQASLQNLAGFFKAVVLIEVQPKQRPDLGALFELLGHGLECILAQLSRVSWRKKKTAMSTKFLPKPR
jgi:hypothetical protein